MNDSTRVLYVAPDEATARSLESAFSDGRTDLELAGVASLASALALLDTERVHRVLLDPEMVATSGSDPATSIADPATPTGDPATSTGDPATPTADPVAALRRRYPEVDVQVLDPERRSENERWPEEAAELVADGGERSDAPRTSSDRRSDGGVDGDHFRALAETLSDALLVIDADSVVRFANPAVEELFGYRPEELVGDPLTKLMSPDLAERHRAGIRRYLDTGERGLDWQDVELTARRKDGSEVPIRISFGEFESDGERRFTGVIRDVTDQRRREGELRTRVRQQEAVATLSRHALEDPPLADLFEEAVELVADALDHEYAGLLKYRPAEDDLLVRAVAGWDESLVDAATIGTERDSQGGYTLLSADPVVSPDLADEERFDPDELLDSAGVRAGVSAVVGSPDDPWGVFGVHDLEPRSYARHDVQFVQNVAHILATAIRRRERERRLELDEAMLDAVDDGVYALDARSRFVAVNDAYCELTGYDREELLGAHASTVLGDDLYDETSWMRDALDADGGSVSVEADMPTADGRTVPVEARVAPLRVGDGVGRVGVVRDVSETMRREEKLVVLTEMTGLLAETETPRAICEVAVDAAVEVLGFPNVAIARYDDDANELVASVDRWREGAIDDALLGRRGEGAAWRAFVGSESRTYDDLAAAADLDAETDLSAEADAETTTSSAVVVPLGKHGVFIAGSPERAAFDSTDASLAELLCSNVRSALDRAEREVALRDQRNDLRAKNRELERVNRLNRVIRELIGAVTQASSPDDVMQATCDRLAEEGPYRFAWFGEYDRASDEIRPRASAGAGEGYLDEVTVRADESDPRGRGPAGRAVRERELQVQNDLFGEPPFEPWREQALERGFRSCVSVPVVYADSLRGVLTVYAEESDAFNEMERAVLAELGETIGYALSALERKAALVSERSTELDFRIRGTGTAVLDFVSETGAEFEFENVVQREDGRLHAFFTVSGVTPDETLAYADEVPWVENVRLVTERDGEYLYESALSESSFLRTLLERGAIPRSITMTEGEGRFVVRIPQGGDVRTFVDLFDDQFEQAELVARRERDEPVLTRQEFEAELRERLTDRQQEVLQMAYFGGFFDWPRGSTAQEIADALGVSQPTVSRHIRGGERVLFGFLFEDR